MIVHSKLPMFQPNQAMPKFITLEGCEGSGKSTQSSLLADYIKDTYQVEVINTREPGGSVGAEKIRSILSGQQWDTWSELLLLMAARRDHIISTIEPNLKDGAWVICDRFYDSSIVYQGLVIAPDKIEWLYNNISNGIKPDLTIIIDIDPTLVKQRLEKRKENSHYYDQMGLDFHQKIRQGFLNLARNNADRCRVVDGNGGIEETFVKIVKVVDNVFG